VVRGAVLILLAIGLSACSFDADKASLSVGDGPKLVLQDDDVARAFRKFDEGELVQRDMAPPRDDPTRFDRVNGWKARFQRPGGAATKGPLVIDSRADLFDSEDGAKDDFRLYREALDQLASGAQGKDADVPELGDETHAITFTQGAGPARVAYYVLAWRHDNVTASVSINGFAPGMSVSDVVDLAQKQEARIAAAAE
jgi:hypothetical protein